MINLKPFLFLSALLTIASASYSQWSAPLNISPGTTSVGTNENAGQCIAVSGDTVRVTYTDRSAAMIKVMFNQSPDMGITWGVPVVLQSALNCGFTAIANSGSNVHVVWMDSLGSSRASFYRRSLDGGITWQPIQCLDSVTKFWPGIACSGDLVIATLNKDLAGNTEVFIMRSLDNGFSWLPEQQISHALNRSEDPAINMSGSHVHLSWNDKRSGTMNIYYCHSSDSGATWGAETALTTVDSYTSMVCLDGNHVDVPHAVRPTSYFDVWLAESADTGATFIPNQQLTNTATAGELYPFMARDGNQMHIVYAGGGANYLHSSDGGIQWDAPLLLSPASQPFIAYTGCALHVIFANAGYLNYMRNPTGNCVAAGIANPSSHPAGVLIYPNPVSEKNNFSIKLNPEIKEARVEIYNLPGEKVYEEKLTNTQPVLSPKLNAGIYFIKVNDGQQLCTMKFIVE